MNAPTGRIPSIRLPAWTWVVTFVLTTPFLYFFLREGSHASSPTAFENLFLIVYAILLGLNYSFAFKYRGAIFNALPAWLVPQWRRILAYVVVVTLMTWALAVLPLPHFYSEVLGRSVFFLFIPYFLVSDTLNGRSGFLSAALEPKGVVDPALVDSDRDLSIPGNPRRAIFMIVGGLAFVIAGIFMRQEYPAAWFGIVFFGLGVLLGILVLIPGSTQLILNQDGFIRVHLWRRITLRWQDVCDIEVLELYPRMKVIGFNFSGDAPQLPPGWQKRLKGMRDKYGKDSFLPLNYNISAEDLCRVMIERHARALRTSA